MTRDIEDRLMLFGANVTVDRLALNHDQILQYRPPENPTKLTDSRSDGYVSSYGGSSWELDALEPSVIEKLIEDAVLSLTDQGRLADLIEKQDSDKSKLREMINSFKR